MNEPIEVAADRTTLTITKAQPKILAWFEAIGKTEEHTHCFDWPENEDDPRAHVAKQLVEYALRRDKSLQAHPSGALGGTPIVLVQAYLDESPTAFAIVISPHFERFCEFSLQALAEPTVESTIAAYAACLGHRINWASAQGRQDWDEADRWMVERHRTGLLYEGRERALVFFAAERARLEKIRKAQREVDVNKKEGNHD